MAPLPKRNTSTYRKGKRRAAIKLTIKNLVVCTNCQEKIKPHQVCPKCGYYKGRVVLEKKGKAVVTRSKKEK